MATLWYFHVAGEELGPISFKELAELIRMRVLAEEDLVRPSWKDAAQRADSVVGLFRMSRLPIAEQPAVTAASITDGLAAVQEETGDADVGEHPEWLKRLLELRLPNGVLGPRGSSPGEAADAGPADIEEELPEQDVLAFPSDRLEAEHVSPDDQDFVLGPQLTGESVALGQGDFPNRGEGAAWTQAVEAALSKVDARDAVAPHTSRSLLGILQRVVAPLRNAARSRPFMGRAFRIVCAIAAANAAVFWVLQWSDTEAQRFPPRPGQQVATREFPLFGKCSPGEYTLMVLNLMLVAGAGAYGGAAWLESRAEGG
jgi:hypothetical protein